MFSFKNRLFLSVGIVLVIGCIASFAGFDSIPKEYVLKYKTKTGDILKYELEEENVIASERNGDVFEMTSKLKYSFQLEGEDAEEGLSYILTIGKRKMSMDSPRGSRDTDYKELEGKRIRIKIASQGERRSITAIDSLPETQRRGRMGGNRGGNRQRGGNRPRRNRAAPYGIQFFKLPEKAFKVGDSWTETIHDTAAPSQGGGFYEHGWWKPNC